MAAITGTPGNDTITPESVSTGVAGGIPSDAPETINSLAGNDFTDGGGGGDDAIGGRTGFNVSSVDWATLPDRRAY